MRLLWRQMISYLPSFVIIVVIVVIDVSVVVTLRNGDAVTSCYATRADAIFVSNIALSPLLSLVPSRCSTQFSQSTSWGVRHARAIARADLASFFGGRGESEGRLFRTISSRTTWLRLGDLGERLSSPSGSGRSPAAKRIVVHFRHKFTPLWVLINDEEFSSVCSPLKECRNYSAFPLGLVFQWSCAVRRPVNWNVPPFRSRTPRLRLARSGGALKLPQWVRAKPGRQTYFGAFQA